MPTPYTGTLDWDGPAFDRFLPDEMEALGDIANTRAAGEALGDITNRTPGAGGEFSAASVGFSVLSGILSGMAKYQAGKANAATDRGNAVLAERAAGDAVLRGQHAAALAKMRGGAVKGQQKAAVAASGASVSSGSALDLLADTSLMTDMEVSTISSNAAREAWGYRSQATQFRNRANRSEDQGRQAFAGDILGGVTQAAFYGSKYARIL